MKTEALVAVLEVHDCLRDMEDALARVASKLELFSQLIPHCHHAAATFTLETLTDQIKALRAESTPTGPSGDATQSLRLPGATGRQIKISVEYGILKQPWWNANYYQQTPEAVYAEILSWKSMIIRCQADPEYAQDITAYESYHRLSYLRELLVGESIVPGCTTELVEQLLATEVTDCTPRTTRKVINLNRVIGKYFADIYWPGFDVERLTPEFICTMHAEAMEGLLKDKGQYRTKFACPSMSSHVYLAPSLIRPRLESMCRDVRREISQLGPDDFIMRIKIVASFLSVFLEIHPFSNGNGRVARILTSLLLAKDSIVPVSLCGVNSTGRDNYLRCLREAQSESPFSPCALARLILDNVRDGHRTVCLALDLK